MAFFGVKEYGCLIRKLASVYNASDDMYAGATALLDYSAEYFLKLRSAFILLFDVNSYPKNQKLVTMLYEEFIISDDVKKAFFTTQFYDNIDLQIEFVRRNIDYAYEMYKQIQLPLHALAMTAHPERCSDEDINHVMDKIIKPVITNSPEFTNGEILASWSIYAKKRLQQMEEIARQKKMQDNIQSIQENDEEKDNSENGNKIKKEKKYIINDEKPLFDIYHYLKESKEISSDIDFEIFKKVVESANASLITPKTKWKYNVALSFARECIKGDPLAWTRDICTSLKIKSNDLTKNKYPNSLWYQELEELFKNSINK